MLLSSLFSSTAMVVETPTVAAVATSTMSSSLPSSSSDKSVEDCPSDEIAVKSMSIEGSEVRDSFNCFRGKVAQAYKEDGMNLPSAIKPL